MRDRAGKAYARWSWHSHSIATDQAALNVLVDRAGAAALSRLAEKRVRKFEARPERQPCRAASIAAMSIFFMPIITSNARLASSPPAQHRLGQHALRELPGDPHLSLHQGATLADALGPLHPLSTAHPQQSPRLRGDDRLPSACHVAWAGIPPSGSRSRRAAAGSCGRVGWRAGHGSRIGAHTTGHGRAGSGNEARTGCDCDDCIRGSVGTVGT